jgi:long-chain acyl-CoA synthetase
VEHSAKTSEPSPDKRPSGCVKPVILLTGATGFLGTNIARLLLENKNCTLEVVVRAPDTPSAKRRLQRAWADSPNLVLSIGDRVEVMAGDISQPKLGLDDTEYADLCRRVTHIIHSAADLRLDAPIEELRRTNVQGTANVIELARSAHQYNLQRLSAISTAYVAGARTGEISEESLIHEAGFNSAYEQSKYEAELLLRAAMTQLPVSVFRPGMIVGDSQTGEIRTFNTLYFPLRLFLSGKMRFLPVNPLLRVNMVPVDYVAGAIVSLNFDQTAEGKTFHLTLPAGRLPNVSQMLRFTRLWAQRELGVRLPYPVFLPLPSAVLRTVLRPFANNRTAKSFSKLTPYLNENRRFLNSNTEALYRPWMGEWQKLMQPLLGYATKRGFMHRDDRTVHEQVLFRLQSKSRPVRLYDIVENRIVPQNNETIRRDVISAVGALRALGVRHGDRVAIVGQNSTRYMILDLAIGLLGAVSVPLYYTSPPEDIDSILAASGAKILLVGSPKIIDALSELRSDAVVVSFWREDPPQSLQGRVVTWERFLALGRAGEDIVQSPAGFSDLATIRYTSGTTGRPRGVAFNHANLRWLAETVAELPPWRARNSEIRYLSFLPLNHVVEGMLGTYSPYYLPAPLQIFFLEEFRGLRKALPLVRPVLVFSVPRFYEKIWESLEANPLGRAFQHAQGGLKRLLGLALRPIMLRKAGLNKCSQLLVGSAPASEEMLQSFRALGIELHNAYGLTEAPLVTMNRVGHNHIGTVGTPLPETEIRVASDGEILVRGPQVAIGCYGEDILPMSGEWLMTGDLGEVASDGSLVISGRKKELIVTSYGKNILPQRVELPLKQVPGVAEAMLIGDNRPYCVAILWADKNACTPNSFSVIDKAISRINEDLSHPEQVKRWAILTNDLSVEHGDLTPNLKLKRSVVQNRLSDTVEALYMGQKRIEGTIHSGCTPEGLEDGDSKSGRTS